MTTPPLSPVEIFQHVRMVLGMILGLSVTRLLNGLVKIIQHPGTARPDAVHIGWVLNMLLTLVHFWWWQCWLAEVPHWTFEIYLFLVVYMIFLFFLCALLFPDTISDYSGYRDFFMSRRKWFFGVLAATVVFDLIDTLIKGPAHYALFSEEYWFRVPVYLCLCAVAAWSSNRRFQMAFVTVALLYNVSWIVRHFNTLN